MALTALRNIPRQADDLAELGPDDWFEEPAPAPEPPATSLVCTVYVDPARFGDGSDLDRLEQRLRDEIAPTYRAFDFEFLSRDDLQLWSPFSNRRVEDDFLRRGFARTAGPWGNEVQVPARRGEHVAHHRVRERSLAALRRATFVAECALAAVRELPVARRPDWLIPHPRDILAPVCGRRWRDWGDDGPHRRMPLVEVDGLLLACRDFTERRTVLPSLVHTPATATRRGRESLRDWFGLHTEEVRAQVARELGAPNIYFGGRFDLPGVALWMLQGTMRLRRSAEEIRRRYSATWLRTRDWAETHHEEDMNLLQDLHDDYHDGPGGYEDPVVDHRRTSLAERVWAAFSGLPSLEAVDAAEYYGEWPLERLARWLGDLRRSGEATLTAAVADDLWDLLEPRDEELRFVLGTPEGAAAKAAFDPLLPEAGWTALYEAARQLCDDPGGAPFHVSYSSAAVPDKGIVGQVHAAERWVDLTGPFLVLPPVSAMPWWVARARQIAPDGLYAFDRGRG